VKRAVAVSAALLIWSRGSVAQEDVLSRIRQEGREPLKDLGMRKNVIAGIGNTDHLSFRAVGIPGFNPIQEYKDYDVRMHHTNMDLYERVCEQDLKQNAIVMAWFAWQAANTAERLPRP